MWPSARTLPQFGKKISMIRPVVHTSQGMTVAGGGPITAARLGRALARAPDLVAADGGADRLLALGVEPQAVVGDMDSISPQAKARLEGRLHEVGEQSTTDFDKVLRSVHAPFALALGFAGGRMDHGLAVMHGLARHAIAPQGGWPVLVLGPRDLAFHAPPGRTLSLALRQGDPFSLFPLDAVQGESRGLEWPINGLNFSPAGLIGTSNRVTEGQVELRIDAPGMLVILPLARLDAALSALVPGYVAPPSARGRSRKAPMR